MNKRGVNKIGNRVNLLNKENYNEFKLKYPESDITYNNFVTILKESNELINYYILENELGFKLPNNLGYIAVNKFKQRGTYRVIDWKNTNKFNKIVPNLNLHSFGYMYTINLFKNPKSNALQVYKFNAHRLLKRELAQKIKKGKDYYSIDRNFFSKRLNIDNYLKEI